MSYFNGDTYIEPDYRMYFWIGEKSIGKTYWGIHKGLKHYNENKEAFAWVFNTKDEVEHFKKIELMSYIDPLKHYLKGDLLLDRNDGKIIAAFGSVKSPHTFKNIQHAKRIFFDELENGTGDANKNIVFAKFVKIISNMERKKKEFEIYCFMNAETKNNAIIIGMNLKWETKKEVQYFPQYKLKCITIPAGRYFSDDERADSMANTLAKANEQLWQMAFQNQFSYDDDRMIDWEQKNIIKKPMYHINYSDQKFSVYINIDDKLYFDYQREFPYNVRTYSLTLRDFFMNQDNRIKDNEREYDNIYLVWEARINRDEVLFKDYYIKEMIIEFLARRRSIIEGV